MKIALCLSGHARTFDRCASSWWKLRREHDVRVFASVWDAIESNEVTWWKPPAEYRSPPLEPVTFQYYVRPSGFMVHRPEPPWDVDDFPGSSVKSYSVTHSWRLIRQSMQLAASYSGAFLKEFDLVIRSRPDVVFIDFPLQLPSDEEIVCADRGRPVCDAVFYGRPATMLTVAALADILPTAMKVHRWGVAPNGQIVPENLLARYLEYRGISVRLDPLLKTRLLRMDGTKVDLFSG